MRITTTLGTGLILLFAAGAYACRSDDTTDTGTDSGTDSAPPVDATHPDVASDAPAPTDTGSDAPSNAYTVQVLANPMAAGHPAGHPTVALGGTLVATSPRFTSGPSSSGNCTFTIWIGDPAGGPFSGMEVVESEPAPTIDGGMECDGSQTTGVLIPAAIVPGDTVTSVVGELDVYCPATDGGTGCPPNASLQMYLGQSTTGRTFTAPTPGMGGTLPTPTSVMITDINGVGTVNEGMDLALQDTLVTLTNVYQQAVPVSGSGGNFGEMTVSDSMTSMTNEIPVVVEYFRNASCTRTNLATLGVGGELTSVTGILEWDFGLWKLQLTGAAGLAGVSSTCAGSDGGTSDAGDASGG